jgi:hypothetical protein
MTRKLLSLRLFAVLDVASALATLPSRSTGRLLGGTAG